MKMTKKKTNPFYNSKRWRRKREVILKRDEYKCRECRRYGKTTPAKIVHHIYSLEDYPQYRLKSENLISLCNECHEKMYDRFNKVMKEKGIQWMERMKDKVIGGETING
jgi:5-methylcytosine-specific restriction enzyme A